MRLRPLIAALLAVVVPTTLAAIAAPVSAAVASPAEREALTQRLDRAGTAAEHVRGRPGEGGVVVRTVAGVPALVVRADATVADLRAVRSQAVREVRPGVWELRRTVFVLRGAHLTVAAPQVRELRLVSDGDAFAGIVGRGGSVRLAGTRQRKLHVHSWLARRGGPDRALDDGRGSVAVRDGGRLDATDVRFAHLGFWEGRVSGVALVGRDGARKPTGVLRRSDFVRNYFGGYSFEARDVVWTGDRFLYNAVYGLDPHDDSDGFVVTHNLARGNARHGIIFSRLCDDNLIARNVSERNGWHGIVLDDGRLGDGPSDRNRVVDNVVRDNGRVGISIDGSGENRVTGNRIEGTPIGVRLFGPSLGNRVTRNVIVGAGRVGVFVDRPSRANAVVANRVQQATTGVRVRGAGLTTVRANALLALSAHGVEVDGAAKANAGTLIERNVIAGHGRSPVLLEGGAGEVVRERENRERWNYPTARDVARALAWVVGPGLWVAILGIAALGPLAVTGGLRGRLALVAGAGTVVAVALVVVPALGGDPPSRSAAGPLPPTPTDRRVAAAEDLDLTAAPLAKRIVTKDGHPTHPTWYHVSQAAYAGGRLIVAFNARTGVRAASLDPDDLELRGKVDVNVADLGGATDTTGTDTNRHDVPAVVTDDAGRLHVVYGGGSIAGNRRGAGPYQRSTLVPGDLGRLSPETTLDSGGGAAFDFEAAVDRDGVRHLVGQHGRGDTGSLVELRMAPDGRWLGARRIVAGGFRADGCVLDGRPRGCNRFAIARLTAAPDGALHLVWGVSEDSLGGRCETDAGSCDRGLYYAVSDDGGATWRNARGDAAVTIAPRRAIEHDDPAFRVADGAIGLFKAVAVTRDGPVVVHTERRGDRSALVARRLVGGAWRRSVVARPGDGGVEAWDAAPVLRAGDEGLTLWIGVGDRIFRFFSPEGERWERALAYRGQAWSLTGIPAREPGRELLLWRGDQHGDRSEVVAAVMPAGRR